MSTLEETLRKPLTRTLWSRWEFDIVNFMLKRLLLLSGDGVTLAVQMIRVTATNMPRPPFTGTLIWVGGTDEPLNMAEQDIHLAEVA